MPDEDGTLKDWVEERDFVALLKTCDGLFEQFGTLLDAAVKVRDSWLLYENDVDDAHLTSACSDLDQLIGGSPEWVALVEARHSNPASRGDDED